MKINKQITGDSNSFAYAESSLPQLYSFVSFNFISDFNCTNLFISSDEATKVAHTKVAFENKALGVFSKLKYQNFLIKPVGIQTCEFSLSATITDKQAIQINLPNEFITASSMGVSLNGELALNNNNKFSISKIELRDSDCFIQIKPIVLLSDSKVMPFFLIEKENEELNSKSQFNLLISPENQLEIFKNRIGNKLYLDYRILKSALLKRIEKYKELSKNEIKNLMDKSERKFSLPIKGEQPKIYYHLSESTIDSKRLNQNIENKNAYNEILNYYFFDCFDALYNTPYLYRDAYLHTERVINETNLLN